MAKKPRKWSNLDGQIPEEPVELTDREQKIRARCDELRAAQTPMKDLAATYRSIREEEAFEELAEKARSLEKAALERVIRSELERVQDISGQDMWRGEGMTFSPNIAVIPFVTDRQAFEQWIRDTGRESFFAIPEGRVKSLVCDALNEDEAVMLTPEERAALKPGEPGSMQPPPGIGVFIRKGVNQRKA